MRIGSGGASAALAVALALSACGRTPGGQAGTGQAGAGEVGGGTFGFGSGRQEQAKLNGYTGAYNTLVGGFGLQEEYREYAKSDVAHAGPSDTVFVSPGWINQVPDQLKAARKLPGGPAELDASADVLIGDVDRLLARIDGLKAYYASKGYKVDGGARGRAEDPLLLADYRTAIADTERFNVILDARRKVRSTAELAEMKARGDRLGYDTKLGLQQAETVVGLFKRPPDLTDPAVLRQADAQVASLEKTLADQRDALNKARQGRPGPNVYRLGSYGRCADNLNKFIGDYRDLKQSGAAQAMNAVISDYNGAVGDSNSAVNLPGS